MKNIYVVTHAQSIHHVESKVGGWYDTGLTEVGKAQADLTANRLKQLIDSDSPSITPSDLLRAKETAEIIANKFDCSCQFDPGLREMSYGIAEGKPKKWLDERISPAPDHNRLDHISIEKGDSKRDMITRVYRVVDTIIAAENQNHVVVTHGFAFTFVIARWIELPLESAGLVNFKANSAGITHLQQDDYWNNRGVKRLNDTSHFN